MTEDTSGRKEQRYLSDFLASRRRILEVAGAAGFVAGVSPVAVAQEDEPTTFEFGGEVAGWMGRAPQQIAGETNPTMVLEAGIEYEVVWENLDGQLHDFVIQDEEGNDLVGTDVFDEQGATHSFTFTASEEMAQYICTVHPTTMVGEVQVGEAEETEEEEPADDGFVPAGPSVGVELVADGPLVNPVTLRTVPGEENTHFIVDQPGQIYVLEDGDLREEPVLDLGEDVYVLEETRGGFDRDPGFDERGLLGLDFHPNFEENGQLYVRYSSGESVEGWPLTGPGERAIPEEWDHVEVLSEFQIDGDADDIQVDRASERVLLEVLEPQFNHNAGEVVFGPDGYLYTGLGDGGDGGDTGIGHVEDWYDENEGGNAQNVEANLLGSILRIDVDEEGDDRPYGIPEDNPFVDAAGYDEIFSYGLRNPWRMSFDGDRLIAADVGQALFEEVHVIENGGNYGWNIKEGFHCFDPANPTEPPADCPDSEPDEEPYDGSTLVDPVLEYPHQYENQTVGISITGGYVYDGDDLEDLEGYVFGDWSANFAEPAGRIFVATPEPDPEEVDPEDEEIQDDTAEEPEGDQGDEQPQEEPDEEVDILTPDEHPWPWEEVLIEGGEDDQLNRFIQAFGRSSDGDLFVLASRTGRLDSEAGEIYRLVPPDEGETIETPDIDEEGAGESEGGEEAEDGEEEEGEGS